MANIDQEIESVWDSFCSESNVFCGDLTTMEMDVSDFIDSVTPSPPATATATKQEEWPTPEFIPDVDLTNHILFDSTCEAFNSMILPMIPPFLVAYYAMPEWNEESSLNELIYHSMLGRAGEQLKTMMDKWTCAALPEEMEMYRYYDLCSIAELTRINTIATIRRDLPLGVRRAHTRTKLAKFSANKQ